MKLWSAEKQTTADTDWLQSANAKPDTKAGQKEPDCFFLIDLNVTTLCPSAKRQMPLPPPHNRNSSIRGAETAFAKLGHAPSRPSARPLPHRILHRPYSTVA